MKKRIIPIIIILTICINLCSCTFLNKSVDVNEEDIKSICEITTLKCYYNNVAIIHKEANNIFQKDREMWIEYEGYAELSFNVDNLVIKQNGNEITIKIPDVDIRVNYSKETLNDESYICSSDGLLFKNKITAEEQTQAIDDAQQKMKEDIDANSHLKSKAKAQLKKVIENFYNKMAEAQNASKPTITFE